MNKESCCVAKKPCCPWLSIVFQATLGVVFIAASWHKIIDPPDFAKQVYNYKLTPAGLINLVAIYLPWLELACGLALIAGVWSRGAAALVGVMLVAFIALLSINIARDHAVDCACFAGSGGVVEKTHEEMIGTMVRRVVEDAGMLVLVIAVLWMGPVSRPWLPAWRRAAASAESAS